MRLRLLKRKHRLAVPLVQLSHEVFDEGLEQEDHREALDALPLPQERQPRRFGFVAQDDLGFREQVPHLQRHHPQVQPAFPVARRDASSARQRLRDLLQPRVGLEQPPIKQIKHTQRPRFQAGWNLHRLQQPSPELRPRRELVANVSQRIQVEHRQVAPEPLEIHPPGTAPRKWLPRGVEELPSGFECAAFLVPAPPRPQGDGALARVGIELHDLIEIFDYPVWPFFWLGLLHVDFNAHTRGRLRVVRIARQVNVVLGEPGPALPPASRERDADRIEDRRLPGVVRPHEHRRLP